MTNGEKCAKIRPRNVEGDQAIIKEAVQAYIKSLREERGPQTHWWPSQVGKCVRAVILKRAGEPETVPLTDQTLRVFWLGDEVHKALQRAVESVESGLDVVAHELRVRNEEYGVSGKLDTLIRGDDGQLEVIEWKSINSNGFKRDLPQPAHVLQLGIYLTFPASYDVDGITSFHEVPSRGRLCYWSKDNADIAEFAIEATDELRQGVKDVLTELTDAWRAYQADGTLPAPLAPVQRVYRGEPVFFKIGPKKGQPATEPDWRTRFCEFRGSGKCCGDVFETVQAENAA